MSLREEVDQLLEDLADIDEGLTPWEREFLDDMNAKMTGDSFEPSDSQVEKLDQILATRGPQ